MNRNGDGKLSKEEVIKCYEEVFFEPANRYNYCVGIAGVQALEFLSYTVFVFTYEENGNYKQLRH